MKSENEVSTKRTASAVRPRRICGQLLAAGHGERFRASGGEDKLTNRLVNGQCVVVEALLRLQACLSPIGSAVLVVVRPEQRLLSEMLRSHGADVVLSENAVNGMGGSLGCGRRTEQHDCRTTFR